MFRQWRLQQFEIYLAKKVFKQLAGQKIPTSLLRRYDG